MAQDERLYIVTYDIADPKRWRQVFKVMEAHHFPVLGRVHP